MLSADEMLRAHSIYELRALSAELARLGDGKRSELQQVVGSTYHDFVDSADMVSTMQSQLVLVGKHIKSLVDSNATIVQAVAGQLLAALPLDDPRQTQTQTGGGMQAKVDLMSEISAAAVWDCLGECDIFCAAQVRD